MYIDLVNKGILQEQTDWSGYQGSINNGTVVGTINGSWICSTIMSTDQEEQKGNWAVTNMPKLNDYQGATNYSAQGGSTWAISSTCKNYDLAVDFFKSTWDGSTEFYDQILTDLGAIATYLPAADSDATMSQVSISEMRLFTLRSYLMEARFLPSTRESTGKRKKKHLVWLCHRLSVEKQIWILQSKRHRVQ